MTKDEYTSFLGEVRKLTQLEMFVPDETGLVSVRVDNTYTLSLQFLAETSKILCFVEVATLSSETPKEVYRSLLAAGLFGKETAGGYFAIEDESGTLIYNYFFDGDVAAKVPGKFVASLENILQICDMWANTLTEGKKTEKDETSWVFNNVGTFMRA